MALKIEHIIDIINNSAEDIQNELLDCCSHFPWEEFPEGWYQFALMRHLHQAGYKTYPEYGLNSLGYCEGGKVDIAVFESPSGDFEMPSLLIEVKAAQLNSTNTREQAKRLERVAAAHGVSGILVWFTAPLPGNERQEQKKRFLEWCEPKAPIICRWHSFQPRFNKPEFTDRVDLADKEWCVLIATFQIAGPVPLASS